MEDIAAAPLWNAEGALALARRVERIQGLYCGPAAVAWIAAVWNAQKSRSYDVAKRLCDKTLFPDGPRSFNHTPPAFQLDLNRVLLRETQGELTLSAKRYHRYDIIHRMIKSTGMPFIVRIPTASLRDGLHYVTLFKMVASGTTYRCYWQDNGVFRSDESMQAGISVSVRSSVRAPFFFWGAKQVERS